MEEKKLYGKAWLIVVCILLCIFIGYIVLSAFHIPKSSSRIVICAVNVKSLNTCFLVYQKERESRPAKENWCDSIKTYADEENRNIFLCPKDKIGPCSYAMNENIPADANDLPGDLVLLFESAPGWNQTGGADDVITDRHGKPGANIAFADGHVEFVKPEDIPNLQWTVE